MVDTPEISENETQGIIKDIYADIKLIYGVPFIVTFYRQLAVYPKCLEFVWKQVKPLIPTEYVQREAKRLRSMAQLPDVEYESISQKLRNVPQEILKYVFTIAELLNTSNAQNAIISNALYSSYNHGPIVGSRVAKQMTDVPLSSEVNFSMVDLNIEDGCVQRIFGEIRAIRGLVPTFYRVLAKSPELLDAVWSGMKKVYHTEAYKAVLEKILTEAQKMSLKIPLTIDVSSSRLAALGHDDVQLNGIESILRGFSKNIPAMLLEIEIAKSIMTYA